MMGRILAIDYGLKRTGLAWTDPMQIIATGIGGIDTSELKKKITELVQSEDIDEIVLGYPSQWDGSDTDASEPVRTFHQWLQKQYANLPVMLVDERFTSRIAKQALLEGGASKKKRKDKHLINEMSAVLILQSYLEQKI